MMDFIAVAFLVFVVSMATYFTGKHAGYEEYFKGRIECKQAFELVECKRIKE